MSAPVLYDLGAIRRCTSIAASIDTIERSFKAYSQGLFVPAQVGHLNFGAPAGDTHIKSGYRRDGRYFVVKVASSFYQNPDRGLPSSSGMMLLFDQETGLPAAILMDEGYLTDVRTAAAGAVAARFLAPKTLECIGIVGAGTQARLQLEFLQGVTACRQAMVWARDERKAAAFSVDGFSMEPAPSLEALCERCRLIVTATPATTPLLAADCIHPGTHITAVGADTPTKQELDPAILTKADIVAVDCRRQCSSFGELSHALAESPSLASSARELGEIAADSSPGRTMGHQITVADLTGLAIQDLDIATLALDALQADA